MLYVSRTAAVLSVYQHIHVEALKCRQLVVLQLAMVVGAA